MSNPRFERFLAKLRVHLERCRNEQGCKREELLYEVIAAVTDSDREDMIFRASQLAMLFDLPNQIMEREYGDGRQKRSWE